MKQTGFHIEVTILRPGVRLFPQKDSPSVVIQYSVGFLMEPFHVLRLLMKNEDFGSRGLLRNIHSLYNRFRIGRIPLPRGIVIGVIGVAMDDVNDLKINGSV